MFKIQKIKIGREATAPLKGRAFKIEISKVSGSALAAEICTGPHNRLLRRQHCSSLCSQSELPCWRRNRRLCGSVQISAARALPLTIDISILSPLDFFCILNILRIRPSLASV